MIARLAARARLALALITLGSAATAALGCVAIPFDDRPASGYSRGSGDLLRIAVLDETGGDDWTPAINEAVMRYAQASAHLVFQRQAQDANIVVTVRRYRDEAPPPLHGGYVFQAGVGGFAAVYDPDGTACFFPPSPRPLTCTGEIADVDIYLNDIIPSGDDIEARRLRLLLHELGHAMGLTRHSPDLDIEELGMRYGWE